MNLLSPALYQCIKNDLLEVLVYLPYILVPIVIVYLWNKKYLLDATLVGYSVLIVMITLLSRKSGSRDGIDISFFATAGSPQSNAYIIENVLLFIPLGILCACKWKFCYRYLGALFAGVVVSMSIEFTQFMTKRGYVQLDDILMNGLGMVIGCMLYHKWFAYIKKKF